MSSRARIDLLIFGFLLSAGQCAVAVQIPISAITVTTNGTWYSTWAADKVNDGVVHNMSVHRTADACECCAALDRPSWVQLSLDNIYIVERITVLGRQDYLSGQFAKINLSMGLSEESLQDERFTSQSTTIAEKRLNPPREMKLVRVRGSISSETHMTICEIAIYRQADCNLGRYSVTCSKSCHCLEGQCDSVTGTCRDAICADGWKGIACNESCNPGNFGANCSSNCHCHNVTCNHTDGACPNNQCAVGWTHANCSIECGRGFFGVNCSTKCHCLHGANCDPVSGLCPNKLCAPGWTQSNCSIACTMGSYGHNCSMDCHCDTCHHVNGSCEMSVQCHEGYRMENGFCKRKPLQPSSNSTFNVHVVVGVCVGAGVVLTILIAVVIVFYKRRNLQSRTEGLQKPSSSSKIETSCKSNIDQAQGGKRVNVETETQVTSKDVQKSLSLVLDNTPSDDNGYYSFKTLAPGIKVHDLWDYIHEKCQSGSTFFDEVFEKLRSGLIHKHTIASSEENKGKNR